jgi:hypothetical protein
MIAREHDLFLRVVQGVEGVEKLGLRAFLARYELDVVDEKHINRTVSLAEVENALVPQRIDQSRS